MSLNRYWTANLVYYYIYIFNYKQHRGFKNGHEFVRISSCVAVIILCYCIIIDLVFLRPHVRTHRGIIILLMVTPPVERTTTRHIMLLW